jgi:dipeptidyl aminopeptidase/acylaminoacyl peptidase
VRVASSGILAFVCGLLAALPFAHAASEEQTVLDSQHRPLSIEDCIQMVHIQQPYDPSDPSAVFSQDGRQFVTMTWQGNLRTNRNKYHVLLFNAEHLRKPPVKLLSIEWTYSSTDQHARPLSQFAFLSNNRLAALATFHGEAPQVVSIDLRTRAVKPLTRHPGGVLAFATAQNGGTIIYAAKAPMDETKKASLFRDGFSLEDESAIAAKTNLLQLAQVNWFASSLEYFLIEKSGGTPHKIGIGLTIKPGESPHIWLAPDGRYAAVKYVPSVGSAETLGLVDMATGRIERLLRKDAPVPGQVLWARNSRSLVVLDTSSSEATVLSDIDLDTRHVTSIGVGHGLEAWVLLGWNREGDEAILRRGMFAIRGDPERTLAAVRRTKDGWESPRKIAVAESQFGLNPRFYSGTNGSLIVGVKDDLSDPPELAAYDFRSKRTVLLTNLNPQLRRVRYGEISLLNWSAPNGDKSFGYLIKPVGYTPANKYPLIIQLKDETYDPGDRSFIIDGQEQSSGAAIQVWANAGFMVLLTPEPLLAEGTSKEQEDGRISQHIEDGVGLLDSQGLIDREKIAITGWSRAGWYSEYVVTHAKTHFAAATNIDNVEYNLERYSLTYPTGFDFIARQLGGVRPWGDTGARWRETAIDFKYDKAQTPRLIEAHGYDKAPAYGEIYAALKTAGIPVEFYLYPDAPHSLRSPLHRLHSLETHTDWFRFWLQDYEDPAPEKRPQYVRWRKMRENWAAAATAAKSGNIN